MTTMTAISSAPTRALDLVEIVDFKWLMAGEGHYVHAQRLQSEPGYARLCLLRAADSRIGALRETAGRLAAGLGVKLPAA